MRAVARFDEWLISLIERPSHHIQLLTGWDCFDQSRVTMGLLVVQSILSFAIPIWEVTWTDRVFNGVFIFFGVAIVFYGPVNHKRKRNDAQLG